MEPAPTAGLSWSGWQELLAHATVALETPHGVGTGFSVAPGVIATCAHVIAPDAGALPETVVGEVVVSGQKLMLTCARDDYFRDEQGLDLAFLRWPGLLPPALIKPAFAIGDPMWTFGHPDSRFRGGQSALLRYEGPGRLHGPDGIEVHRVFGAPVHPGASGSPVVNLATGAVCGMLCLAGSSGSAHFLSAHEILERCSDARLLATGGHLVHESWLEELSDEQISRGEWAFPGPALRDYLHYAVKAADSHPYPGVVPGISPPALSEVYVQPLADRSGRQEPVSARVIIDDESDAILVGDAGSGKSSFMRVEVKAMIDRYLRGADRRVPVRVMAADLVSAQPLPELIAASVNGELHAVGFGRTLSPDFFARPPAAGSRWLLMVDSLDEVMRIDQRRTVLDRLLAPQENRPFDLIIATRPLTEPHPEIGRYALLPFTLEQVREFASGWFGHLGLPHPADAAERFTAALRAEGVDELAQSPLVATMLCQLFAADADATLPTGRTKIYERFVELLNGRRFSGTASGIRQQLLSVLAPYGRDAEDVGEALLSRSQELVQRLAFARQKGTAEGVLALLAEWTAGLRPGDVPPDTWRELLSGLIRRSGQLAERHGEFMFLHQTIEEYLAAQYVAADPHRTQVELSEVFDAASWKTGSVTIGRQSYARFLVAVCGRRPEVAGALHRIARRGGLHGARFVAALGADGIQLEPPLARAALTTLRRHALRSRSDDELRLAVTAAAQLDARAGQALLIRQIRKRRNGLAYRRWALTALSEAAVPNMLLALQALARANNPHIARLLARLTRDPDLSAAERRWAAEALLAAGDPRGRRALLRLAADRRIDSAERRNAFATLGEPPKRRAGLRLARFTPRQQSEIPTELRHLIAEHLAWHRRADAAILQLAYETAVKWHAGQYRESGDEYVTHPLAVAEILAQLGMDTTTVMAALLKDLITETTYPPADLEADFGPEVTSIVAGLGRGRAVRPSDANLGETIRKLVIASANDPRILVLALAERLHDMRTLHYLRPAQQEQIARETLEFFAPLAHRLGMNIIKWELEDLAFAKLYPKRCKEMVRLRADHAPQREALLRSVIDRLGVDLARVGIAADISEAFVHLYAVYAKMVTSGRELQGLPDFSTILIRVDSVYECYTALSVIHATWRPMPGRLKDLIAMPGTNLQQCLSTAVIGPHGRPLEIQVKTHAMHDLSEYGVANRWRNGAQTDAVARDDDGLLWLRRLLDWQWEESSPEAFLENLRYDLASEEIVAFTPRGEPLLLPKGSTPVDFAYSVHTEVGHRCIGARVNGRLIPLEAPLSHADIVEIFTSKSERAGPSKDWLGFVQSARARTKIRQYFHHERRDAAIEAGRSMLARAFARQGIRLERGTADLLRAIAQELRYDDVSQLYEAIGDGLCSEQSVVARLAGDDAAAEQVVRSPLNPPRAKPAAQDSGVVVTGVRDVWTKLARCCTPVPGDDVFGFLTRSGGVSVHRKDCDNAAELLPQPERVVPVEWQATAESSFLVQIQVEALDRHRLLADVTRVLSDEGVNILSTSGTVTSDHMAGCRFSFRMADPAHLGHLLRAVRGIDGVFDCYRITSGT